MSTLPAHTPITQLVQGVKIRGASSTTGLELKHRPGLDTSRARHWFGWRHPTLVIAAYLFILWKKLAVEPKA